MNRSNRNRIILEQIVKSLSSLPQLNEDSKYPIVWRLHNLWNEKLRPYSRTSFSIFGSQRDNNDIPEEDPTLPFQRLLSNDPDRSVSPRYEPKKNPWKPSYSRTLPTLHGIIRDFRNFHNTVGIGFDEKELPEIRSVLMDAHIHGMRKVLQRNSMKPEEYRSALEEGGLDILHPNFNNHVKELTGLSVPETTRKRKSNPEFGDQET